MFKRGVSLAYVLGIDKKSFSIEFYRTEPAAGAGWAIYQATSASAIVHAHPPHAIALALAETEIVPTDAEGLSVLNHIPVLVWDMEVKPGGQADIIAQALKKCRTIMVCGHGSFAIGQLLEEAHNCTTMLEESCQVICLLKSLRVEQSRK